MLQAAYNDLIVILDNNKKFNDEITTEGGVKLFVATQFDPGEHANCIGTVVSLPKAISTTHDYTGFSTKDINIGDKVIMRYDVVFHYSSQPDREPNRFKYELFYKGQSYFRCNIQKAFAVIKPDGSIRMLNGYVMLFAFHISKSLHVPLYLKKLQRVIVSPIMHIGRPLSHLKAVKAKAGDKAIFNPAIAQTYTVGDKGYVIIKQHHIYGIER